MLLSLIVITQVFTPLPPPTIRFAPPVLVATGARSLPTGIDTADLDGDGLVEIFTANSFDGTISVLHNRGQGNFVPTTLSAGGGELRDVTVADVTGDGLLDVVASQRGGASTLVVFDGLPNGGLASPRFFGASLQFSSDVELSDLDLDGDLDAVVASSRNFGDPLATVFLQDGTGDFGAPLDHVFLTNVPFSYDTTLAVGDANGDGIADLIGSGQPNTPAVALLLGLGDGTFAPAEVLDVGVQLPMGLVLQDLDGDGDDDLAVYDGRFNAPQVVVARNDGSAAFPDLEVLSTGGSTGFEEAHRALAFGDFNGDGPPDLVTSNTFAVQTPSGLSPQGPAAFGFEAEIVDLDGDGRLDALIATRDPSFNGMVAIHLNRTGSPLSRALPLAR